MPIPGVFKLNADNQWVPAIDPLHWDKPQIAGVGLGREFARALINARPEAQIGLIPAAVGGTALERWLPGADLYLQALERLRVAQQSGKLVAILWHQGESDTGTEASATTYAERWVRMMKQLRTDAGAPDVPIIAGELGDFLQRPFVSVVNEQIASLPRLLDSVAIVPTQGLAHKGDELHFDAASQRELGRRYAKSFLLVAPDWSACDQRSVVRCAGSKIQ